jgi:RimJ/RimL family protein N-acetyltransferase
MALPSRRQRVNAKPRLAAVVNWRAGLPLIETRHAMLREVTARDAAAFAAALGRPEVMEHLPAGPSSPAQFARFIAWARRERMGGRFLCFAVVPRSSAQAEGLFQLWPIEPGFAIAELGFALAPSLWGTGLFRECAAAIVSFAFTTLDVRRIECRTAVTNRRGLGALRKLGAVYEGTLRGFSSPLSEPVDHTMWSILHDEWNAREADAAMRVA